MVIVVGAGPERLARREAAGSTSQPDSLRAKVGPTQSFGGYARQRRNAKKKRLAIAVYFRSYTHLSPLSLPSPPFTTRHSTFFKDMPARNDSNDTLHNDDVYAPYPHYNQRVNNFQSNLDGFKLVIMGSVGMQQPTALSSDSAYCK